MPAVTTADLIAAVRRISNTQRTQHVTDSDILGFANGSIEELYDLVVQSRESYFAETATFNLAGSNSISLAEVTTGLVPVPPFDVEHAGLSAPDGGATNSIATPVVTGVDAVEISRFTVAPALGNLSGQDFTIALYVNGAPSGVQVTIPASGSGSTPITDFVHTVFVDPSDILAIVATPADPPAPGSDWTFTATFTVTTPIPESRFYKELALCHGSGAAAREIPPLDTITDRNRVVTPHYWIQGETLSFYPAANVPAGPFTLDYVPNCPVLEDGDVLPTQLERFREFMEVGAAVKVQIKRQKDTSELERRQLALRQRVVSAVSGRKAGPKRIPMPAKEQYRHGRRGWPHGA